MRISNVTSVIAFNTVMARFAPNHGKRAYRVEANGDITLMVLDECDYCGKECEGANSVLMVKPREFVLARLAASKLVLTEVTDESGCNDAGDCVCPDCYAKCAEAAGEDVA
jgi:hypothetical protein